MILHTFGIEPTLYKLEKIMIYIHVQSYFSHESLTYGSKNLEYT